MNLTINIFLYKAVLHLSKNIHSSRSTKMIFMFLVLMVATAAAAPAPAADILLPAYAPSILDYSALKENIYLAPHLVIPDKDGKPKDVDEKLVLYSGIPGYPFLNRVVMELPTPEIRAVKPEDELKEPIEETIEEEKAEEEPKEELPEKPEPISEAPKPIPELPKPIVIKPPFWSNLFPSSFPFLPNFNIFNWTNGKLIAPIDIPTKYVMVTKAA